MTKNANKKNNKAGRKRRPRRGRRAPVVRRAPLDNPKAWYASIIKRAPRFRSSDDGSLFIEHHEFVADVGASGGELFERTRYQVNPGINPEISSASVYGGLFTWLRILAKAFNYYEFEYLKFTYVPFASKLVSGTIAMAWNPDPTDPGAVNNSSALSIVTSNQCSTVGQVGEQIELYVSRKELDSFKGDGHLKIRLAQLGSSGDPHHPEYAATESYDNYDNGFLTLVTENADDQLAHYGVLMVSYGVRLIAPTRSNALSMPVPEQPSVGAIIKCQGPTPPGEPFPPVAQLTEKTGSWISEGANMIQSGYNKAAGYANGARKTMNTIMSYTGRAVANLPGWLSLAGEHSATPLLLYSAFTSGAPNVSAFEYSIETGGPIIEEIFDDLPAIEAVGAAAADEALITMTEAAPLLLTLAQRERNMELQRCLSVAITCYRREPATLPVSSHGLSALDVMNALGNNALDITKGQAVPLPVHDALRDMHVALNLEPTDGFFGLLVSVEQIVGDDMVLVPRIMR